MTNLAAGHHQPDRSTAPRQAGTSSWWRKLRHSAVELAALVVSLVLGFGVLTGVAFLTTPAGLSQLHPPAASVVAVTPGGPTALTVADVDAIARDVPDVALVARAVSGDDASVVTDGLPHARVEGVDPSYAQVWEATVSRGTFFTAQDASAANRVAVLGQSAAQSLFPNEAATGQTIRIRNLPFTVVGVLAAQPDADTDNAVLVPFQTGQIRLFGTNSAYGVLLQVRDPSQAGVVSDAVQQLVRQRHHVGVGQPSDFSVRTDSTASSGAGQTTDPTVAAAVQLVEQYTCRAKALCTAT